MTDTNKWGFKMKTYGSRADIITELASVQCNACGASINKNDFGYFDEYLSIEKHWGYPSEFDGETHNIDICEDCYKKLLQGLAIKPI